MRSRDVAATHLVIRAAHATAGPTDEHKGRIVELTKKRRNDVFTALMRGGLDPATCELGGQGLPTTINHPRTASFFTFSPRLPNADWTSSERVGTDPQRFLVGWLGWENTLEVIADWAKEVVVWEGTPDLWSLCNEPELAAAVGRSAQVGNTPFSPDEMDAVGERLEAVLDYVRASFELTEEQLQEIGEKLADLVEASTRVGRKDWLLMLYGAAFTLIVSEAVPPTVVQSVLGMVVHGLAHIFGLGSPPPAIPA